MDPKLVETLHKLVPPHLWQTGLQVLGVLSIPRLLAWGAPLAAKAADYVASKALNSPAKPLVLWAAPNIIKFLDEFNGALAQIATTFRNRLSDDLAKAQAEASATPPAPEPPAEPTPPPYDPTKLPIRPDVPHS